MCYYKVEEQERKIEKFKESLQKSKVPFVIQRYLNNYLVSVQSKQNYWSTIKAFLEWAMKSNHINKTAIFEITPKDLSELIQPDAVDYREFLYKEMRLSHSSVQTKMAELRAFWNYLVSSKVASENIFNNLPKNGYKGFRKNTEKVPLPQDVIEMINNIKQEKNEYKRNRNLTLIRVLQGTGLRRAEVVALNTDNVDLENHTLKVMGKGLYHETDIDTIHIPDDVVVALKEWYQFRSNYVPDDIEAIFVNRNGNRISSKTVERIVEKYSNGKITPHMLRHFYATILYQESKGNMVYVAQQMRHHRGVTDSYIDGGKVHF